MSITPWLIKGPSYGGCNCAWGCPCQFNHPPTHGDCRALDSMRIDEGFYGDVDLTGLCWINTYGWPKAVHEGNGEHQSFIDERANEKQRAALVEIIHGRDCEPGANYMEIFASTMTTVHDPIFTAIEFECDLTTLRARVTVPGLIESTGAPMMDPFTKEEQRVKLVMPGGMEFKEADCGSSTTKCDAAVKLDFTDAWGQFAMTHITHEGVVG